MDSAGIRWEYEEQELEVTTPSGATIWWLPDFWLPEAGQFCEVKGALTLKEAARLIRCANAVGVADGGCGGGGHDVTILGYVPPPGVRRWPIQLHFHNGLWGVPWQPLRAICPFVVGAPEMDLNEEVQVQRLLHGGAYDTPGWAAEPLQAARSARFELGKYGAPDKDGEYSAEP